MTTAAVENDTANQTCYYWNANENAMRGKDNAMSGSDNAMNGSEADVASAGSGRRRPMPGGGRGDEMSCDGYCALAR